MIEILLYAMLVLISLLFAAGVYQFSLVAFGVPSAKVTRTIKTITRRQKSIQAKEKKNDDALIFISKFIKLSAYNRDKLQKNLKIAGISKTPEVYYAGAVYKFLQMIIPAIILLFIFPLLSPVLIILAVLKFVQELQKVTDCIKKKRRQIEFDLPRFVYSILHELKSNHDVLSIFERHKDSFSPELSSEIAITIADMRTGNYEAALQRLEGRIGSTSLSEVVRGLTEMSRGHETQVYWETLAFRFSEAQKQHLRKEALKVPPKVRKLSFFLLICIMITYAVVLGFQLISNINVLF